MKTLGWEWGVRKVGKFVSSRQKWGWIYEKIFGIFIVLLREKSVGWKLLDWQGDVRKVRKLGTKWSWS